MMSIGIVSSGTNIQKYFMDKDNYYLTDKDELKARHLDLGNSIVTLMYTEFHTNKKGKRAVKSADEKMLWVKKCQTFFQRIKIDTEGPALFRFSGVQYAI